MKAECPICMQQVRARNPLGGDGTAVIICRHDRTVRDHARTPIRVECNGSFRTVSAHYVAPPTGQPKENRSMPVYNTPERPRTREDGWPTRNDMTYWSDAERACYELVGQVEQMGASESLTRAVTLLGKAREAIADHVERIDA